MDGFRVISAFHPSDTDLMSTRVQVNCLLVVVLYSIEAVAPLPQKRLTSVSLQMSLIYIYKVKSAILMGNVHDKLNIVLIFIKMNFLINNCTKN